MEEEKIKEVFEKLKEIKKEYDTNNRLEEKIENELTAISKKVINKKFNPNNTDIIEIYDIMDSFSDIQRGMRDVWDMAIFYDSSTQALLKTFQNSYKELYNELLISDEIKSGQFKNIAEKNAYIDNKLKKCNKYIYFAEKQNIKSKELLSRVRILSDLINQFDNKVSRKVSVMQIQNGMGNLPSK